MKTIHRLIATLIVLLLVACGGGGESVSDQVTVQEVQPPSLGYIQLGESDHTVLIRTATEWQAFWAAHTFSNESSPATSVDFKNYSIAGLVAMANAPSRTLTIDSIALEGGTATIGYSWHSGHCPTPSSCIGGPFLYAYSVFVLVPKQVESLRFVASK
jgi:hypothetical protein